MNKYNQQKLELRDYILSILWVLCMLIVVRYEHQPFVWLPVSGILWACTLAYLTKKDLDCIQWLKDRSS